VIGVNVAVLGMGLIGGSLTRALAAAGHQVSGFDRDPAIRRQARAAAGGGWRVAGSVAAAVAGADVAVVATPLPAVESVLEQLGGFAGVVTDVVSVKQPVRSLMVGRPFRYVGGHPMAGKETAGFAASDPGLFAGCAWVLCLDEETLIDDWVTLARIVTGLGARAVPATAARHDGAVAAISHVPHLLAVALASALRDPLAGSLAAGSFRDGTRVAASPPSLIGAICGGNAGPVLDALDTVLGELAGARAALGQAEPIAAVTAWATPAHDARVRWPATPGEPRQLPLTREGLLALGEAGGWVTEIAADGRTATVVGVRGG
jgi:prephenate dehydrogenase